MGLDRYEILGVPRTATTKQIEKAYRNLSKTVHPDADSIYTNPALFREATESKDILVDPVRRRQYDEELERDERSRDSAGSASYSYDQGDWRPPTASAGSTRATASTPRLKKQRSYKVLTLAASSFLLGRLLESLGTTASLSPLSFLGGLLGSFAAILLIAFIFVSRERADRIFARLATRWSSKDSSSRNRSEAESDSNEDHDTDGAEAKVAAQTSTAAVRVVRPLRQNKVVIPTVLVVVAVAALGLTVSQVAKKSGAAVTSTTTTSPTLTLANPTSNTAPDPDFYSPGTCSRVDNGRRYKCSNPCFTRGRKVPLYNDTAACTGYVQQAVNAAHQSEGLPLMNIPTNWTSLTKPEQLFVLINLERVARGYPAYVGLNATLSARAKAQAMTGVSANTHVAGFKLVNSPKGQGAPAVWGAFSAMEADFVWMYTGGWSGSTQSQTNKQCTSATGTLCWFARDALLGFDPQIPKVGVGLDCTDCEVGAAFAVRKGVAQWDFLIEAPSGPSPSVNFSWSSEEKFFQPGWLP